MKTRPADIVALIAALLLGWQVLSLAVGENIVSSPATTILRAVELLQTRSFWGHAASTGIAFGLACVIAIAGGVLGGLWLGLRRFAPAQLVLGGMVELSIANGRRGIVCQAEQDDLVLLRKGPGGGIRDINDPLNPRANDDRYREDGQAAIGAQERGDGVHGG